MRACYLMFVVVAVILVGCGNGNAPQDRSASDGAVDDIPAVPTGFVVANRACYREWADYTGPARSVIVRDHSTFKDSRTGLTFDSVSEILQTADADLEYLIEEDIKGRF